MQHLRQAILKHVRIPVQQTSNPAAAALSSFWRGFAGGGYLDKDEVTERVLNVAKHFEKVDPAKVGAQRSAQQHVQQIAHARAVPTLDRDRSSRGRG